MYQVEKTKHKRALKRRRRWNRISRAMNCVRNRKNPMKMGRGKTRSWHPGPDRLTGMSAEPRGPRDQGSLRFMSRLSNKLTRGSAGAG